MNHAIRNTLGVLCLAAAVAPAACANQDKSVTTTTNADKDKTVSTTTRSDKSKTRLVFVGDDDRKIEIKIDGDNIEALVDGKKVPESRIVREGELVIVNGEDGEEIQRFYVNAPAGVVWTDDRGVLRNRAFAPGDRLGGLTVAAAPLPKVMVGVTMSDVGEALGAQLGVEPDQAFLISSVTNDSPAAKAGVEQHDVVVAVNGQKPATQGALRDAIKDKNPGDTITLTLFRKGETKDVTVTLEEYKADAFAYGFGQWKEGAAPQAWTMELEEQLAKAHDQMALAREQLAQEWSRAVEEFDDEDRARLDEAMERVREALERIEFDEMPQIQFFGQGPGRTAVAIPAPVAPSAPAAPRVAATPAPRMTAGFSAASQERLDRLEERMARIEALLERIAAEKEAKSGD